MVLGLRVGRRRRAGSSVPRRSTRASVASLRAPEGDRAAGGRRDRRVRDPRRRRDYDPLFAPRSTGLAAASPLHAGVRAISRGTGKVVGGAFQSATTIVFGAVVKRWRAA